MGGVKVPCLVDTGSMVSTISESFFRQNFEPWGQERLQSCHWLQLRAANGLEIPYIGYLELEVRLCGKLMSSCGVLIVRDTPGGVPSQVPGVLGMNIIRKCYQELFGQHGLALFSQPCVSGSPEPVVQALQQCHCASTKAPQPSPGKVKVRGKRAWRIPGGIMKIVAATCSEAFSESTVLFEPLDVGLPAGLITSPALVQSDALGPVMLSCAGLQGQLLAITLIVIIFHSPLLRSGGGAGGLVVGFPSPCFVCCGPLGFGSPHVTAASQTLSTQHLGQGVKSLWVVRIRLILSNLCHLPVVLRQRETSPGCVWVQCEFTGI
ncbi:hypothetical protein N1851_013702 [Merluccius polli]|uniref:Uncharacterized protein n=1 Tax=Merluccius polli TaxID=89951 RepID=A0AA47P3G2_MERPO|nr:hypothetical protein N1851_013702 [Merluccius polli]